MRSGWETLAAAKRAEARAAGVVEAAGARVGAAASGWRSRVTPRRNSDPAEVQMFDETLSPSPEMDPLAAEALKPREDGSEHSIREALELAAQPLTLEYRPATPDELSRFRTVPVNASVHRVLVDVVKAANPKNPTLFTVVLPKGASLAKAVGGQGFRGFAQTGGRINAQAVLVPVGAAGVAAASWPVLALAASVMAVDRFAQKEQRAHQRRVEAVLARQELRAEETRVATERSIDAALSRAISDILDGRNPDLEVALHNASMEFELAKQFLARMTSTVGAVVGADGTAHFDELEKALGGQTRDIDAFVSDLHFARAAIALFRKALMADAASDAIVDPENPYAALQRHLQSRVDELERAATSVETLTADLLAIELTGKWYHRDGTVASKQDALRAAIAPPELGTADEIQFLALPSGEIHQLVPLDADR